MEIKDCKHDKMYIEDGNYCSHCGAQLKEECSECGEMEWIERKVCLSLYKKILNEEKELLREKVRENYINLEKFDRKGTIIGVILFYVSFLILFVGAAVKSDIICISGVGFSIMSILLGFLFKNIKRRRINEANGEIDLEKEKIRQKIVEKYPEYAEIIRKAEEM